MCRDGYHVWQWGSSSTGMSDEAPLHLRCQCGLMTYREAKTLEECQVQLQAERSRGDRLAAALIGAGMPMADGLPCFCYYPFETEPHRAACRAARAALDSDPSVEGG